MQRLFDCFLNITDRINEWVGKFASFLIVIIALIVSFEVIMRYVFQSPTIWAWDVNVQLFAIAVFMGGGYTLLHNGHVRVDIIYSLLSERKKAALDLITSPIFFIFLIILLWKIGIMALDSIEEREVMSTIFAPRLYPMKIILTIGIFLFLMQGIAKLIRDIRAFLRK